MESRQQIWSDHQDGDAKWREKNNQELRKSGKEKDREEGEIRAVINTTHQSDEEILFFCKYLPTSPLS
jgi:hypothetical protein